MSSLTPLRLCVHGDIPVMSPWFTVKPVTASSPVRVRNHYCTCAVGASKCKSRSGRWAEVFLVLCNRCYRRCSVTCRKTPRVEIGLFTIDWCISRRSFSSGQTLSSLFDLETKVKMEDKPTVRLNEACANFNVGLGPRPLLLLHRHTTTK